MNDISSFVSSFRLRKYSYLLKMIMSTTWTVQKTRFSNITLCREVKLDFITLVSVPDLEMKRSTCFSIFKNDRILGYLYITCIAYVLLPTVSLVIDEIVSSNHSEGKSFPVVLDYGVDMEQYFYHLFIPVYASMLMIANAVASYDNTYMLHVQHTSALFAIVR